MFIGQKFLIVFNINDKPLAEKLSTELKVGKVVDREKAGHVLLQILAKEEVLKIINLINGHLRTGKIKALSRVIHWYNNNSDTNIKSLPLDQSSIDSNAWLAGFSQNNGFFSMTTIPSPPAKQGGGGWLLRIKKIIIWKLS